MFFLATCLRWFLFGFGFTSCVCGLFIADLLFFMILITLGFGCYVGFACLLLIVFLIGFCVYLCSRPANLVFWCVIVFDVLMAAVDLRVASGLHVLFVISILIVVFGMIVMWVL